MTTFETEYHRLGEVPIFAVVETGQPRRAWRADPSLDPARNDGHRFRRDDELAADLRPGTRISPRDFAERCRGLGVDHRIEPFIADRVSSGLAGNIMSLFRLASSGGQAIAVLARFRKSGWAEAPPERPSLRPVPAPPR